MFATVAIGTVPGRFCTESSASSKIHVSSDILRFSISASQLYINIIVVFRQFTRVCFHGNFYLSH